MSSHAKHSAHQPKRRRGVCAQLSWYWSVIRGNTVRRETALSASEIAKAARRLSHSKSLGKYYFSFYSSYKTLPSNLVVFRGRTTSEHLYVRAKAADEIRAANQLVVGDIRLPTVDSTSVSMNIRPYRYIQIIWPSLAVMSVFLVLVTICVAIFGQPQVKGTSIIAMVAALLCGFIVVVSAYAGESYICMQQTALVEWFKQLIDS